MDETHALSALALGALALALPRARRRLELSRAKHRSLAGHARIARRVAALIPGYAHDDTTFFAADDAPPELAARRRAGFERLAAALAARAPATLAATARARRGCCERRRPHGPRPGASAMIHASTSAKPSRASAPGASAREGRVETTKEMPAASTT